MREIQVEITNQCPLNCVLCSSKELRMCTERGKVTLQNLTELITRIPGQKRVFLTGGEPLSCYDLEEICGQLSVLPDVELGLYTCGVREKDGQLYSVDEVFAKKLFDQGIRECYLSLYGYDANSHIRFSSILF